MMSRPNLRCVVLWRCLLRFVLAFAALSDKSTHRSHPPPLLPPPVSTTLTTLTTITAATTTSPSQINFRLTYIVATTTTTSSITTISIVNTNEPLTPPSSPPRRYPPHAQLMTRESPWADLTTDGGGYLEMVQILNRALQSGLRPSIPAEARSEHPDFVALTRRCWAGDPEDRPTFADVAAELSSSINTPVQPSTREHARLSFSVSDSLSEPLLGT
jgi:hypothetical protein